MTRTLPTLSSHPALTRPLEELAVELTVYCNLKCEMCSVWELREHGVPFELACELLEQGRALGATTFTPCGAESFMRKDFLDVVEHAHALGYERQDIVTNGTMITDAHLDRLEACPSVALHISIDGPRAIHDRLRGEGNYDKAVATARACVDRGIEIGLSGVILKESLDHLKPLVSLAAELGVGEVSFQPFQTEISGPEKDIARFSLLRTPRKRIVASLEDLAEHAEELGVTIFTESLFGVIPDYLAYGKRPIPPGGCYLPSKFLLVDFRGDVYPCFFMRTDQDRMGNVLEGAKLTEIWHSVHHDQLQTLALNERCPGCLAACSDVETFGHADGDAEVTYAPPARVLLEKSSAADAAE
ncbi:MAG TPA: radical SAM protein [Sandaracinaceae bacterium LLY-WYZ-13_1]|nr:radical SAM protein [Sandaracinaceae bacterium LLY-WYZ-13_1]